MTARDDGSELLRWHRLEALWDTVRALPAAERAAFLDAQVADDPALHVEITQLLEAADGAEEFLGRLSPIVQHGAEAALGGLLLDEMRAGLAGRYTLEREIGRGGTATVFLARDVALGRPVAMKVLHPHRAAAIGPRRFAREIRLAASLDHPNILPLLDSGQVEAGDETPPRMWYAMPWVEGGSLRGHLSRQGPLAAPDVARIGAAIAGALDHAHARGFIHRDVKPENILLDAGRPLIADFGIARAIDARDQARLTHTGITPGTPIYMSPEQAAGAHDLDGRSDEYSLGCVLLEMLTGQPPERADGAVHELIRRWLREAGPDAAALGAVIGRALAHDAADRFRTCRELATALDASGIGAEDRPSWASDSRRRSD